MQQDVWDNIVFSALGRSKGFDFWQLENGSVMQVGLKLPLLVVQKGTRQDSLTMTRLENIVKARIAVQICYCSLYDDCWRYMLTNDFGTTDQGQCGSQHLKQ